MIVQCQICNARFPFQVSVPNHICKDGRLNGFVDSPDTEEAISDLVEQRKSEIGNNPTESQNE